MVEPAAVSPAEPPHQSPTPRALAEHGVPVFAALDLGTNNCRLLVGRRAGHGFAVLDSLSRAVRLGEGLEETGRLDPAAMERAIAALGACAERLARWQVSGLAAVATEACRRATNGADFLVRVERETGLSITIISPREEALLAVESCAPLLLRAVTAGARVERRVLLFDIGGGSTELAWLRLSPGGRPSLVGCASIPVGVVTLAERYREAAATHAGYVAMVAATAPLLAPFEAVHCIAREIRQQAGAGVCLLGTSGTVTTLAAIALALPRYRRSLVDGARLSRGEAVRALAELSALDRAGLLSHPCIGPDRAAFVLPGAAIFAAILETWPAPQLIVADRGLREALLLRAMHGQRQRSHRLP